MYVRIRIIEFCQIKKNIYVNRCKYKRDQIEWTDGHNKKTCYIVAYSSVILINKNEILLFINDYNNTIYSYE